MNLIYNRIELVSESIDSFESITDSVVICSELSQGPIEPLDYHQNEVKYLLEQHFVADFALIHLLFHKKRGVKIIIVT
jgi:hypothetical protein